jgi:hypothetical protein
MSATSLSSTKDEELQTSVLLLLALTRIVRTVTAGKIIAFPTFTPLSSAQNDVKYPFSLQD